MRPIIQALEFHISAVLVNPRNGAWNFGSTFGNSTWEKKEKENNHLYAQGTKNEVTKKNLQKQEKERAKSNSAHTPGGSFAA